MGFLSGVSVNIILLWNETSLFSHEFKIEALLVQVFRLQSERFSSEWWCKLQISFLFLCFSRASASVEVLIILLPWQFNLQWC